MNFLPCRERKNTVCLGYSSFRHTKEDFKVTNSMLGDHRSLQWELRKTRSQINSFLTSLPEYQGAGVLDPKEDKEKANYCL